MAEIVFTTECRGKLTPAEGKEGTFTFQASGTGPKGEAVTIESDVVMRTDGFTEAGTITYAGRGSVKFQTVGVGHLGASPVPGLQRGAIIWNVTEGDGEFRGASGLITSNFVVSEQGDAVDNNYVRLFTP